jgi:small subunit ribosomal protein S16
VELKRERVDYWTSKGAQVSDRVKKLLEKPPTSTGSAAETTTAA